MDPVNIGFNEILQVAGANIEAAEDRLGRRSSLEEITLGIEATDAWLATGNASSVITQLRAGILHVEESVGDENIPLLAPMSDKQPENPIAWRLPGLPVPPGETEVTPPEGAYLRQSLLPPTIEVRKIVQGGDPELD